MAVANNIFDDLHYLYNLKLTANSLVGLLFVVRCPLFDVKVIGSIVHSKCKSFISFYKK